MSAPSAAAILRKLGEVPPGSTACPGKLARTLGSQQRAIRPLLAQLASEGAIAVTQRGESRDLATLRGPYRVALTRASSCRSRS